MAIIPNRGTEHTVWVVYDLRDPDQWEQAREDRQSWAKGLSEVHTLDVGHILIAFYPGGALEAAA